MLMGFHFYGCLGLWRLKCLELSETGVGNNGLHHLSGEALRFTEFAGWNNLQRNELLFQKLTEPYSLLIGKFSVMRFSYLDSSRAH